MQKLMKRMTNELDKNVQENFDAMTQGFNFEFDLLKTSTGVTNDI